MVIVFLFPLQEIVSGHLIFFSFSIGGDCIEGVRCLDEKMLKNPRECVSHVCNAHRCVQLGMCSGLDTIVATS